MAELSRREGKIYMLEVRTMQSGVECGNESEYVETASGCSGNQEIGNINPQHAVTDGRGVGWDRSSELNREDMQTLEKKTRMFQMQRTMLENTRRGLKPGSHFLNHSFKQVI